MINELHLMSFSDFVMELGSQYFDMSSMLTKISSLKDDTMRECEAFRILQRRKQLLDLRLSLRRVKDIDVRSVDLKNLEIVNAILFRYVVCDMSVVENTEEMKEFVVKLIQSKMYQTGNLTKDCTAFINKESASSYEKLFMYDVMHTVIHCDDLLRIFASEPKLFKCIMTDDAHRLIREIDLELDQLDTKEVIDIIFDCSTKRALSRYAATRDSDLALTCYVEAFEKILTYEVIDLEEYVSKAAKNLADFEGVIECS